MQNNLLGKIPCQLPVPHGKVNGFFEIMDFLEMQTSCFYHFNHFCTDSGNAEVLL